MPKPFILLIDDDRENLTLLEEIFSTRYDVDSSSDPAVGLAKAFRKVPDLALIDIDMPGMNGFEVCQSLRASPKTANVPVIFLTSNSHSSSMQQALRVGANDYLVKPFRVEDLLNRVEFRLGQIHVDAPRTSGNLQLDPASLSAYLRLEAAEKVVPLPRRAFRVLEILIHNEGRVVTREQFLEAVWGSEGGSDRAIDLHICRLRKLLKGWDRKIEALYGKGYWVKSRSRALKA